MSENTKWWEPIDSYETGSIVPFVVWIVRCRQCGCEFETNTLQIQDEKCPECGYESSDDV